MNDPRLPSPEQQLCEFLKSLPRLKRNRYSESAQRELIYSLFWSLAGGQERYMRLIFPDGRRPPNNEIWKLRKAQGGADGDEFTEAARGKACGHIFKSGEATYRCKTCSADDTCVLCSWCYESSDHTGHMVYVSVSQGNSGCCDCGDPEAWRLPVHCSIHTPHEHGSNAAGKAKEPSLPDDLVESIRMTIGRAFDYICDVISCSPEQLRLPKSEESIMMDEKMSRLTSSYYKGDIVEEPTEYALLLWNDEKHTVQDISDQVSRACKVRIAEGTLRAIETDAIGRSIIKYDTNISNLLRISKIIEEIKVTVTIRSARDTFREQMCGTIIEWLSDISVCSVGSDHNILRHVICEEMLKEWHAGSEATNRKVGRNGIDDHQITDEDAPDDYRRSIVNRQAELLRNQAIRAALARPGDETDDDDSEADATESLDMSDDDDDDDLDEELGTFVTIGRFTTLHPAAQEVDPEGDVEMTEADHEEDEALEVQEATMAGYPPPPPPPPVPPRPLHDRDITPSDSDTAEPLISSAIYAKANLEVPKTPKNPYKGPEQPNPARYWLESPSAFVDFGDVPLHDDLWKRVRLDWLILFDLRMWKKVRVDLRDLYISTVVTIPQFKRVLGLRFAGLYTTLAQLYLIADREPDHSIINISLQMLTTPSITAEIVERGNFLTNLMAILYTFLTTRQVGHPHEIFPNATLAFDSGSVTNRRMYHFFMDLKYLFSSEHVQEQLRNEERYMLQFLDLVRLHQGICPNVRAIGEHVEYETDTWISASLVTREINRLCRQFSESFRWSPGQDENSIFRAIRTAAKAVILSSLGTERKRFTQCEIKDEIKFKKVGDYEFNTESSEYTIVKFIVEEQPISFHHALHYTLSWLIEGGKSMPRQALINLLSFTTQDLLSKPRAMGTRTMSSHNYTPEDHLMAAFDYPLRVCAWLAQMKASMWVRNGMSLRHQQGTYRGVGQRDVSHHRDIFLLQTALVVCSPSRVLASIIDRYGMQHWMKGLYEQKSDALDDSQHLDVAEDLIHLLIVLLSDRTSLLSTEEEPNAQLVAMRRDIIHVLCFKPLSFSEICGKLPDKFQDHEECQDILDEMATFKAPEGLNDIGSFELKEHFLEEIDPYIAHYNKNQREESENAYKAYISKKTGRPISEIVFEAKLRPIQSGAFADLSAFVNTGMFAQIVYYALLYPLKAQELTPTVPITRVETFLHVVLHLVLIAIAEDKTNEEDMLSSSPESFVHIALTRNARSNFIKNAPAAKTIVAILEMMSTKEVFKSCHSKILLVLKRMKQKQPRAFEVAYSRLGVPVDRVSTASPANSENIAEDRERKKRAALERQAKVMEQFQQQQRNFMDNQGDIDWGEEEISDENIGVEGEEPKIYWEYPSGTCILCQEECKDGRLYGTFALITESCLLRQTDFTDSDFIQEAIETPFNLDRSADHLRPFGVAGKNRQQVNKVTASGVEIESERHFISKGFPKSSVRQGPVSVGCNHIMHYKCFEQYCDASQRRHNHQIARHQPEDLSLNEFVCPLCKALGNAFLPVIWPSKEEVSPAVLDDNSDFYSDILAYSNPNNGQHREDKVDVRVSGPGPRANNRSMEIYMKYNSNSIVNTISGKSSELLFGAWEPSSPPHIPFSGPSMRLPGAFETNPAQESFDTKLSPIKELVNVYRRLRDTMQKNNLPSHHPVESNQSHYQDDLCASDTLAKALGFSISAVELAQRGIASQPGLTFLDNVPHSALTHLRVLSETAFSYVSIGGIKVAGDNRVSNEFCRDYERQYTLLFGTNPYGSQEGQLQGFENESLLQDDIFVSLTEFSLCLSVVDEINIKHITRLCLVAELVKLAIQLAKHSDVNSYLTMHNVEDPFAKLCIMVWRMRADLNQDCGDIPFIGFPVARELAEKYALTFLRKTLLLYHVKYGIAFNNKVSSIPEAKELDRLSEAMFLPNFDSICFSAVGSPQDHPAGNVGIQALIHNWIGQFYLNNPAPESSLSHPTIFELVGLPKNYDKLMEETMKRRCPTTGKDVSDAMLCLLCGEIFCGQSMCCLKEGRPSHDRPARRIGGAQQHMLKCQKNVGIFINIRKCCVFYVYHQSGSFAVAPYVDRYGEVDPGLRHSRQLFLNQKRYDALLRAVWLTSGVPSVISRKLEADINNGGWETI
ncbi:hypothetical protein PVAG01_09313 [Phlyctema vagabunda]|uniref:E3 ubiquitin-protein ligase n=1 Tax=Phlyctema vagabunda TaxID=108571 RepID=A0ABR4P7N6_9HELO